MGLRSPSRRFRAKRTSKLDLVPLLDVFFVLGFVLLLAGQFVKSYEIDAGAAEASLTVRITEQGFVVLRGTPAHVLKTIPKLADGSYDTPSLREEIGELKQQYAEEENLALEPVADVDYAQIVRIMDACRLFPKLTFGNLEK